MLLNITWVAECQAHKLIYFIWWMIHQGASVCSEIEKESGGRHGDRLGDDTNGPCDIAK